MTPDPSAVPNLYVVINQQPQGPYSAAQIQRMLTEGQISLKSLICKEGGAAWVSVEEFEPALRAVLPPLPPVAYGAARAPGRPAAKPVPVPAASPQDTAKPFRLLTLIGAMVLFFLPWVELRCSGQRFVYQSGVQTILNQGSADESMENLASGGTGRNRKPADGKEFGDKVGISILAGAAMLALGLALFSAWGSQGGKTAGTFAGVALACLLIQSALGFPLERSLKELVKNETRRFPVTAGADPGEEAIQAFARQAMPFEVRYAPWFYGELALLGIAAGLGFLAPGRK